MINCTDPDFTPIHDSLSFPNVTLKDDGYGFNESNCHMLSLCMKVSLALGLLSFYRCQWQVQLCAAFGSGCDVHACEMLPLLQNPIGLAAETCYGLQVAYESTIVIKDVVKNDW